MSASESVCRIIVQKGNLYFQADSRHLFGTRCLPVFSQYIYNAKAFKDERKAQEKAKAVGGVVRLFDAINGEII